MLYRVIVLLFTVVFFIPCFSYATTWWDVESVKRVDGNIEYSIPINKFVNSRNGDVFSGIVTLRYGLHTRSEYLYKYEKFSEVRNLLGKSIVALNGTINGRDISKIPLFERAEVKYVVHDDHCKYSYMYNKKKLY